MPSGNSRSLFKVSNCQLQLSSGNLCKSFDEAPGTAGIPSGISVGIPVAHPRFQTVQCNHSLATPVNPLMEPSGTAGIPSGISVGIPLACPQLELLTPVSQWKLV